MFHVNKWISKIIFNIPHDKELFPNLVKKKRNMKEVAWLASSLISLILLCIENTEIIVYSIQS